MTSVLSRVKEGWASLSRILQGGCACSRTNRSEGGPGVTYRPGLMGAGLTPTKIGTPPIGGGIDGKPGIPGPLPLFEELGRSNGSRGDAVTTVGVQTPVPSGFITQ